MYPTQFFLQADSINKKNKYLWSTGSIDTMISVTSSGIYSLTVTNEYGCKDTTSFVVVKQIVNSTVKIISVGPNSVCEGDSVVLKADPIYKNYTYLWSTGIKDSMIVVVSGGTYFLTFTDEHGCQDTSSFFVNFNPKPKFSIKVNGSLIKCRGDSLLLEALPADTNLTYLWSTGNTRTKIFITSPGIYFLTVTNPNGCFAIDSVEITQNSMNPKISSNGPTVFCTGDSIILTGSPYGKDINCLWSTGAKASSITVKKTGKYIYFVTNKEGCTESDTLFVVVNNKLAVAINGKTSFCNGDSTFLLAQPSGPNYKYKWSTGDTTNWLYASKPGKYWVIVSLNSKCQDSAGIVISQNTKPDVDILSVGSTTFCNGDSVILKAFPKETGYNYQWSTGERSDSIIVKKSGTYSVFATNSDGCKDTASIKVNVTDIPNAKILYKDKKDFCFGDSIVLSASPEGIGYIYSWSTGERSKEITVKKSGNYGLTISLNDNCYAYDSIDIKELPIPEVKIIGKSGFCAGESITLQTDKDFVSYLWNTVETTKQIIITQAGNYSVEVIDTNGCRGTADFTVKEFQFKLSGNTDLDFGKTKIGTPVSKKLTLKNESNSEIRISKISTKSNSPTFTFTTNPAIPATLKMNETIEIEISFLPKESKQYQDSLIVETDSPCQNNISSLLKGEAGVKTLVWLPDTSGKVGENDFCISLRSNFVEPYTQKLSYSAKIRFSATTFLPDSIYKSYILGTDRFVEMSDSNISLSENETKLGEFCGTILLANNDRTPLYIDEFEWSDSGIETDKKDGSLTLTGLCVRNLSRLKLLIKDEITLSPNPAEDFIEISVGAQGTVPNNSDIRIFNVFGETVKNPTPTLPKGAGLRIDVSGLPSGVYFVWVGDKVRKFVKI